MLSSSFFSDRGATLKVAAENALTGDWKWSWGGGGEAENTFFLVTLYNIQKNSTPHPPPRAMFLEIEYVMKPS